MCARLRLRSSPHGWSHGQTIQTPRSVSAPPTGSGTKRAHPSPRWVHRSWTRCALLWTTHVMSFHAVLQQMAQQAGGGFWLITMKAFYSLVTRLGILQDLYKYYNYIDSFHKVNCHRGKEQLMVVYRNARWMSPKLSNNID